MKEMGENHNDSSSAVAAEDLPGDSFTTTDFLDKIRDTLVLAQKIQKNTSAKNNTGVQSLLNVQGSNVLRMLTRINDRNPLSKEFDRPKFADSEKFALLSEINDSIVDKTIHYTERVRNIKEGKQDLIEVHAKMSKDSNFSRIELRDFKPTNVPASSNSSTSPASSTLTTPQGQKRKALEGGNRSNAGYPQKRTVTFLASTNVPRPQTVYRSMKVDNAYSTPFIPKLKRKPHAVVPLEQSVTPIAYPSATPASSSQTKDDSRLYSYSVPTHVYPHPYQKELEAFEVPEAFLHQKPAGIDAEQAPSVDDLKPANLIQTKDQLFGLVDILKRYTEIAVDVEHHSFRTYQGITCLLQISTADEDYILDVFPLWSDMEILNEIFTNPAILKVFHGADYDIIWLQRDLGLYVVNLFDTGIAAKTLNYSHLSLSYLVGKFADFTLDKRFQLADWRIRPLPEEMVNYARYDTHFLLYIYRMLKAELLEKGDQHANLLRVVMEKSRDLCLKRYEKKLLEPTDHLTLLWKNNLKFNSRQLAALKALYVWRDRVAREEDESTGYVLPNNLLLKICEILPREQQGILACCNPIPPLVRQQITDIHKIILDVRSKPLDEAASSAAVAGVKNAPKLDTSIDLTVDWRFDDHNQRRTEVDGGGGHPGAAEMVPLLSWAEDTGKFVVNKLQEVEEMDVDEQKKNQTKVTATSSKNSLSDMFIGNLAGFIRQQTEKRQAKAKVDNLFADYVSPFSRYTRSLEKRKGQEQSQQDSASCSTTTKRFSM